MIHGRPCRIRILSREYSAWFEGRATSGDGLRLDAWPKIEACSAWHSPSAMIRIWFARDRTSSTMHGRSTRWTVGLRLAPRPRIDSANNILQSNRLAPRLFVNATCSGHVRWHSGRAISRASERKKPTKRLRPSVRAAKFLADFASRGERFEVRMASEIINSANGAVGIDPRRGSSTAPPRYDRGSSNSTSPPTLAARGLRCTSR